MSGGSLSGRSTCSSSSSSVYLYQGRIRTDSSYNKQTPLRFINHIYLPDTNIETISSTRRSETNHKLTRSRSSEVRPSHKPRLAQTLSVDEYSLKSNTQYRQGSIYKKHSKPTRSSERLAQTLSVDEYSLKSDNQYRRGSIYKKRSKPTRSSERLAQTLSVDEYSLKSDTQYRQGSIYKKHSKPTRSSEKRRGRSRTRSHTMGNPYSIEDMDSSFESNGPSAYDGPITFSTSKNDRRPLPKLPTEVRREMIEQARDSRRDVNMDQSRRRSRSHDPNLDIQRYFSYDLDPDSPDYRPAGRYKKHNPRERRISTTSREFNIDNFNRNYFEMDDDNINIAGPDYYEPHREGSWNRHSNKQISSRNRNGEQKVINSILKKNDFRNNRSRSDSSGEGLRINLTDQDGFLPKRNRSQSYGPVQENSKTNTIYFYQTRL